MKEPLWTRARTTRMMCLRFGFSRGGGVDTRAVAAAMGVSQRTVQRWLHTGSGRSLAHIPDARLRQLQELLVPGADILRQERINAANALDALTRLRGRKSLRVWREQRWLEPHRVTVVEISVRHLKIRQLVVTRDEPDKVQLVRRRGRVVDDTVVPTRFHATLVLGQVLDAVGPWRFQAGPGQVVAGFTQAWLADRSTPRVGLDEAAAVVDQMVADRQSEIRRARRAAGRSARRAATTSEVVSQDPIPGAPLQG